MRQLEGVSVQVGNLGTSILGLEAAGAITINQTAAGHNWSVNATRGPAADGVDLLTVLEHELGHVIGLSDNTQAGDLMDITLGLGVRRSPSAADLATIAGPRAPRSGPLARRRSSRRARAGPAQRVGLGLPRDDGRGPGVDRGRGRRQRR